MSDQTKYCRVCSKTKSLLRSVYTHEKNEYLPSVIYNISGVKISKRQEPDAKICNRCAAAVVLAQTIILRCQETEEYLAEQRWQAQHQHHATSLFKEEEVEKPLLQIDGEEQQLPAENCEMYEIVHIEAAHNAEVEEVKQTELPTAQLRVTDTTAQQSTITTKTQIFQCDKCDYNTKTGRRLIEHRREEHKIHDRNIYACTLCSQRFSWKPTLYRHIQLDHKTLPEDKKYLCNECGRAYTREVHLIEHIKQRHGPRRYKCPDPECEQTFTRAFTLRRHYLASHTDNSSVRYHCAECDKYFKIYDLWKYHNEVVHKNETVYCPRCGYPFRFKEKLEEHLEKNACKRSIIPCTYCQRRFTAKQGLKEHLKAIHHIGD